MKKLLPLFVLLFLVTLSAPALADHSEGHSFTLTELDGSGVSGQGSVQFGEEGATVNVQASGLEPNRTHEMHIHGIEGQDVSCSSGTANEGSPEHAHHAFGDHLLDLEPYPAADASGNISFDRTYTENIGDLPPLGDRVIVLHGANVDGEYDGEVAVACGEIQPASSTVAFLPGVDGATPRLLYGLAAVAVLALIATGLVLRNARNRT